MRVLLVDQIAKVNYKYTFPLANGLRNAGVKVNLAIDQKKERENLECRRFNLFNSDEKDIGQVEKALNYVDSYRRIGKLLSTGRYDILHTEWYILSPVDYFFISLYKKKYHVRYVATVHDILPFNQHFYDMHFHKKLYGLADRIILQAPGNVDRFRELFPENQDKVRMIPHGHMLDYVEPVSREEAREKLGIPADKTVFLFFGQIKKVKGVDYLLKAFLKLLQTRQDAYLVVAGSVWKADFTECQSLIDENDFHGDLRTDIRYIPDEDVKYYYSAADVCVLPYTDVYQSGVIQLAYGYKKPVVATNLPAFTQFVKEGETGFVAEKANADSLALAMERAIDKKDQLREIGERGYELVRTKLDWNVLAEKIVEECYN